MTSGKKEFSLLELNACVRNTLQESLPERYWVRAEISEARIHPSGHCYLELIEKEEQSGKTVAKARATIGDDIPIITTVVRAVDRPTVHIGYQNSHTSQYLLSRAIRL